MNDTSIETKNKRQRAKVQISDVQSTSQYQDHSEVQSIDVPENTCNDFDSYINMNVDSAQYDNTFINSTFTDSTSETDNIMDDFFNTNNYNANCTFQTTTIADDELWSEILSSAGVNGTCQNILILQPL